MKIDKITQIAEEFESKHLTADEVKEILDVKIKYDFRNSFPKIRHHLF